MLQYDGNAGNPCTCFMYMKPTEVMNKLLVKWTQAIVDADSWYEDQVGATPSSPMYHRRERGTPTRASPGHAVDDVHDVLAVVLCLSVCPFLLFAFSGDPR